MGALPDPYDRVAGRRTADALGLEHGPSRALVIAAAGSSPFLARLMERTPDLASEVLASSPEASLARAANEALAAAAEEGAADQMKALRAAKRRAALASALGEIAGAWPVMESAAYYSRFADSAVSSAARMALGDIRRLGFKTIDNADPEKECGLAIIAMGKHGAFELNYSSDIDLVILFDSANERLGGDDPKRAAVAAARTIVSRLNDQTADGYVFRTDLRLRPDPGVSAAAVSVNAAESYYEAYGQNWERAAYIKARACAGDMALGEEFISRLSPFIWRRSLDFAAIEDVHSLLRQINEQRGGDGLEFKGFDLKRGAGGIRSIEFFAQAQQLLGGGKNPDLRQRATLDALGALRESGAVSAADHEALDRHYRYLRKVENRLQMIADEQTHRIPGDAGEITRLAAFLGEEDAGAFHERLFSAIGEVRSLTSALFEPEPAAADSPALVFAGIDNDPATIAALKKMGFERPEQVANTIRRWSAGETRATRTPRARALLQQMTGPLLDALARASAPDVAFAAFDSFLRGLPAGIQIFSLFLNRPVVFDRLIRIMTVSPYLAGVAARRPTLVEALLENRWPEPAMDHDVLQQRLATRLEGNSEFESAMNVVRRWNSEQRFTIAAQLLLSACFRQKKLHGVSVISLTSQSQRSSKSPRETERQYGSIAGALAIVALGRLGARSMTATSDIDLMFIYEAEDGAHSTDDTKLDAATYFGQLVRRFLAAVTTPTEEGVVYEVDMKLRPSGAKSPVAVSLPAFTRYYEAAWTWEKMALTKARVVAGELTLSACIGNKVEEIIRTPRDVAAAARDVDEMRERLRSAKPALNVWDLKYALGGITDLDFIIQYLTLTAAPNKPLLGLSPSSAEMLRALKMSDELGGEAGEMLAAAQDVFEAVIQLSRAAAGGVFALGGAGEAMQRAMAEHLDAETIGEAQQRLLSLQKEVRAIYEQLVLKVAKSG
ncbi:MAG: bifunctional [glutamine synthetase] adenylyltransferase/[glutamine synthetase]-adenylyl-L-tyrosine phosphorylase [Parvularculaceae bacterium]